MGLDTTHDAWHGSYSSFNDWRKEIARHFDIDLEKMEGFSDGEPEKYWSELQDRPINHLLNHSDCDGQIAWELLSGVADDIKSILPKISGTYNVEKALLFIKGCRKAYFLMQNLEFR